MVAEEEESGRAAVVGVTRRVGSGLAVALKSPKAETTAGRFFRAEKEAPTTWPAAADSLLFAARFRRVPISVPLAESGSGQLRSVSVPCDALGTEEVEAQQRQHLFGMDDDDDVAVAINFFSLSGTALVNRKSRFPAR